MASRPILVGASGSEQSLCAVSWAAREAALRGVPLRIVAVIPSSPGAGWRTRRGGDPETPYQAAARSLEDAAISASWREPDLTIDTSLRTGDPGPVLADLGGRASILVAGSGAVSGPVSRYLAGHAPCPVVIHRDLAAPAHQVVLGVRDPSDSEAPLAFALEEASRRGAHLLVVQAWRWQPKSVIPAAEAAPTPAELSAQTLTRLHRLLEPWQHKYPEVEIGEEIIRARPGHALAGLTATADLLVLGRHTRPIAGTDMPPGSVTHAMMTQAQGPVVFVPE
jgi:nucleotide-binding universal stress UspA family protein